MSGLEPFLARCARDWRGHETEWGPATGFVYFIQAGFPPKAIKIGYTVNDPRRRLASLQTSNHEHLKLLGYFPATLAAEAELHEVCREFRLRGEWFYAEVHILRMLWDQVLLAEQAAAEAI